MAPHNYPSMAHQFGCVLDVFLEAQHLWSGSIGCQNLECLLPIKRIIGLLQIYIDLIEQGLVAPGQALIKLCLNCGRPCNPPRKSAVEAIMELDQC